MTEHNWLAERFEEHRGHLRAVAYRMLGSGSEADDAVQEAWLRLSRTDSSEIENLGGWLTTVVSRVCLDMLRSRASRREEVLTAETHEAVASHASADDPEHEAVMADSVGLALLVVLDTLTPAERLAFVLHDMFGMPFEEIAPIVDRTPTAARQLASRARRRVQGAGTMTAVERDRQRAVVDAFLAAAREGDFSALLTLLDPNVVLRADQIAVDSAAERQAAGAPSLSRETRGAATVAHVFAGRARAARPALIDGVPGLVFAQGGQPRVVFDFTVKDGRVTGISITADPARVQERNVVVLQRGV